MYRMWAPDHGSAQNGRKKHEKSYEKRKIMTLQAAENYVKINTRDIFYILAL